MRLTSLKNIFLFSILLSNFFGYSQNNNSLHQQSNIPTSPEAALFSRFGDVQVSHYTGTAKIEVPLYTIKVNNVELPITLRYHNSGIKVEDQATWVGLGWDLSPGGAIIQEVRGIRDAYDNNLNTNASAYATFKSRINDAGSLGTYHVVKQKGKAFYDFNPGCPTVCDNGTCIPPQEFPAQEPAGSEPSELVGSLLLGNGDPDIYHYSFNGYSGSYYINPDSHQVVLIDKNEQIYFEMNGENSITATTLDGTKYVFADVEYAYEDGYMDPYTSIRSGRTYKMSYIQFLNGKTINFFYVDGQLSGLNYIQGITILTSGYAPMGSTTYGPPYSALIKRSIKTLSKITTADATINFNLDTREDINLYTGDNVKRLKSIDILSNLSNKKVKTFEFSYSYFPYSLTGCNTEGLTSAQIAALGKRLRLDSVREIGYNESQVPDNTQPAYQFQYDLTNTMPLTISFAKDFWGYYNGEANQSLLPDLGYFDYPYQYLTYTNNVPFKYNYTGANRYTNNSLAGTYLLKKITYPTGGYTEFGYGPNSFTNQFIPNISQDIHKNYLAEETSISSSSVNIQFKLSKTTTIHFENKISNGKTNPNGITPLTASQMAGCYIKFYKFTYANGIPQTTLIKQWDLSTVLNVDFETAGEKVWIEDLRVPFDSDPNPYFCYHVAVYFPGNLKNSLFLSTAGVSSHFSYYDDTNVDTSISKQCGMRIETIKNYNFSGELLTSKSYQYFGGKLLNRFQPITSRKVSAFLCTQEGSGYCNCPAALSDAGEVGELSISPNFIKEGGNMIGYDRVDVTELDKNDQSGNGKKSFEFLNFENLCSPLFPVVVNLKNGLPSRESVYDNSGNLIAKKTYSFQDLNGGINCFYGIQIVNNFLGNFDPNEAGSGTVDGRSKYSYYATPIISEWNKLQNLTTTQYYNGNAIDESESYTYNSNGNISTYTKINSRNESLITKYYYPIDGMINSYVDNYMVTVHNVGTPVITDKYIGTQFLSREKTVYGSVSSAPTVLPQYYYTQKGTNVEEKRNTINSYDNKGNITQYTQNDYVPVSFLWDSTGEYLLAKVENATYSQISSLSGKAASYSSQSLYNSLNSLAPNTMITTYSYSPLIGMTSLVSTKLFFESL